MIDFEHLALVINIIIRTITAGVFGAYLIPLFVKEAQVKNGLKLLRYELLFTGVIIFVVNIISLFMLLFQLFGVEIPEIRTIFSFVISFGFLGYALLKLRIYTHRYSVENKKLHAKFEAIENKELKKAYLKK